MNDLQISVMLDNLRIINETLKRIELLLKGDMPDKPPGPSYLKRELS